MPQTNDLSVFIGLQGLDKYFSDLRRAQTGTDSSMRGASSSVGGLSNAFNQVSGQIPGIGRGMSLITAPLLIAGAAIAGVGAAFAKSISSAADFNHEFLQLKNLNFDKSAAEIQKLNDTVLNTALATGKGAKELSTAFFDFQSITGIVGDAAVPALKTIAKFSTATGTDLNVAVNSALKAMKAFGLETKDLDKFLASSFASVQLGKVTFDELARVQVQFAGPAAGVNQTVNEANKIFTAFTVSTQSASEAANLAKTAFQGFADKKLLDAIKAEGVGIFDVNNNLRPISGILEDLQPKLTAMSGEKFLAFKESIGGPDGIKVLLDQVKNQGTDLIATFKKFDETTKTFDLDKLLENAKGDFTTLKEIVGNQINTLFIKLGQEILPPVSRAIRSIGDAISLAATDTVKFHQEFPKLAAFVDTVTTAFKVLQIQLKAFFEGLKNVGTAIQAAIGTVFSGQFLDNGKQALALAQGQVAYALALKQVGDRAAEVGAKIGFTGETLKSFTELVKTQNVPLGDSKAQFNFIAASAIEYAKSLKVLTPEMQAAADAMKAMTEEQKKWLALHPAGSIAALQAEIEKLNGQYQIATTESGRAFLKDKIAVMNTELEIMLGNLSGVVTKYVEIAEKIKTLSKVEPMELFTGFDTSNIGLAGPDKVADPYDEMMSKAEANALRGQQITDGWKESMNAFGKAAQDAFYSFSENAGFAIGSNMKLREELAAGNISIADYKNQFISVGEMVKKAIIDMIPLALQYLGLFLLDTAVKVGFPAGIPFVIAGTALLGLSAFTKGLIAGTSSGDNKQIEAPSSSAAASTPPSQTGLSSFGAESVNQFQFFMDGEELTVRIKKINEKKRELRGG